MPEQARGGVRGPAEAARVVDEAAEPGRAELVEAGRLVARLRDAGPAPVEDVERLHHLLSAATVARTQAWAELLAALATDARCAAWRDVSGRPTFEVARRTLLAMGYPFAFQLEPEALLPALHRPKPSGWVGALVTGVPLLWNLALLTMATTSADATFSGPHVALLAGFGVGLLHALGALVAELTPDGPRPSRAWMFLGLAPVPLIASGFIPQAGLTNPVAWILAALLSAPSLLLTALLLARRSQERGAASEPPPPS